MIYKTFTRTFWKLNRDWPDGREPSLGRRTYKQEFYTEEEARAYCQEWNANHPAGKLSRKCEYESS